jgi:hypothetical protein
MARLPALPLIGAALACAGCKPAAQVNEARTVNVASAPPASAPAPVEPAPASARRRIVVTRDRARDALWSVSTDGKTTRLDWPVGAVDTTGRAGAGGDAPIASRDGKRVAYVRDGARKGPVVVRNLESATSLDVDAPARSELLVTDWSADGRRLLFTVAPLDGPNGVIANPDGSDLRFFVYDVIAQRARAVRIPERCEYQAWLPSGDLLVTCAGGSVLARAHGDALARIAMGHTRFSQAHVGENGAIAVIADGAVLLLAPGTYAERVGPNGGFADYQFPKPSPSGRRVGYTHHVPTGGGNVRVDLEIDGKKVADDVYDFEWLDEGAVVVLRTNADPSVVRI